ncbi:hypothetical protein GWK47_040025 [Chionoecetes opilio]|uniref:Ig-like domain-containing protein n=1 Tax=Chionoecetes opilio TaxID=41210 RepID=A0A8J4YJS4_CHIOP|nr:hypothetical protein GWK47_040025 [Chionoecetes opilio]
MAPVVNKHRRSRLLGHPEVLQDGSTIELKCTISQMPQAQTLYLLAARRPHAELRHLQGRHQREDGHEQRGGRVHTLHRPNASPKDSGNYTCSLGDVATGSVLVHVLNGAWW